ncbi:hypothetical protein NHX12_027402 [Muraenolepis orangiensis]|uniref:Uncharacterized protein n=1 Tax=Muraenolepis orangiensis TaxID=630683 RepID=A0A9Q0EDP2_9TELE|nr:hypothetical protein NHX12_027402 [Muraenolepis orangiensis]
MTRPCLRLYGQAVSAALWPGRVCGSHSFTSSWFTSAGLIVIVRVGVELVELLLSWCEDGADGAPLTVTSNEAADRKSIEHTALCLHYIG